MEKKINIFGPSGCLSRGAMLSFFKNSLPVEEMMLIQQHLDSCELCRDALEGLSMISPERRKKELEEVALLFDEKIKKRKAFSRKMVVSMAAALLALMIGFYSIFRHMNVNHTVIVSQQLNRAAEPPAIVKADESIKSVTAEKQATPPSVAPEKKEILTPLVQDEVAESAATTEIQAPAEAKSAEAAPMKEEEVIADKIASTKSYTSKSTEIATNRSLNADNSGVSYVSKPIAVERKMKTESVYYSVDQSASFQNGDIYAFKKYVEEKLNTELSDKISGFITITFMVDTHGDVKDAFVVKGLNASADSLALQIVKNSPQWKPARQDGKEVNQSLAVIITVE